ncbi:type II secretion system protein M [Candidatus Halobeggiatoa sp. HSG11]|nr:type II secretion system protein M [Candidatus Halobeggiatoa sp. HSG11]
MKQWIEQLSSSERKTIIWGVIIVITASVYFLMWEPFTANYKQLQNIVAAQKDNLSWMQNAAAEVQSLRGRVSAPKNLLSLIDTSIRNNNLNKIDKRIEPKGKQEVLVSFSNVSFTELVQWLSKLYNQHKVQITAINIEHKLAPDQVAVKLTLQ